MTQIYTKGLTAKPWRKLALLGLLGLATGAAHAQNISYGVASTTNTAGTYTDLGTTGTAIATANTDDANSAATPIGFSFSFNNQTFTNFVLNTNGAIRLGDVAPSAADLFITQNQTSTSTDPLTSTNVANTNILMPFNIDLIAGSVAGGAEYRVATTGTAPNRVCTIQWKNVSDKAGAGTDAAVTQYASFNFQLKLYETTNRIEFVYGTAVAGTGTPGARFPNVGIKGSGSAAGQTVLGARSSSVAAWSTTTFITGNYTTFTHNFRSTTTPDVGRTYRFEAIQANDVAVKPIYSLGKLPIPYGAPHVVRAYVSNVGTAAQANVTFTLTVTGANTFTNTKTVAALPVNAAGTLSFDPFTPTNPGTNTITVTAANDDNNTNNASSVTQLVNATTFAYAQPGVAGTNEIGFNTGSGILGAKYTTSTARTVTGVTVRLASGAANTGNKVYGVVLDANGALIARSPDYTILAADLGTDKTFALSGAVPAGNFIVGLAQTANATTGYFPVSSQTYEIPTRADAFFSIPIAGGTPADAGPSNLGALMIEAITSAPATCPPPSGIAVASITSNSAVVSFTGPANGTSYAIIYGPRGFNPASAGTTVTAAASPFTITGLSAAVAYDVYVRAICVAPDQSTLAGPVTFTTPCVPPIISTFPYTENFDGATAGSLPCGVTVADINNDQATWNVVSTGTPASAPNHMRYNYSTPNAANDWFFTPALFMRAGFSYQVTFKYKGSLATLPEGLEVKYGSATTPAAQSNLLWSNTAITNVAYVTSVPGSGAGQVRAITPTTSGNQYIGFHAISAADQFNLYVDDVVVTATAITGTSAALQRAISLYPNPAADQLTLEVSGANAKNGLQVEITNMLGQRVRTATARDNFRNQLDISGLANGLYTVKVINGSEYTIQNVAVQK